MTGLVVSSALHINNTDILTHCPTY